MAITKFSTISRKTWTGQTALLFAILTLGICVCLVRAITAVNSSIATVPCVKTRVAVSAHGNIWPASAVATGRRIFIAGIVTIWINAVTLKGLAQTHHLTTSSTSELVRIIITIGAL